MVDLPLVALDLDRTTLVGVQYLLDDLARSRLLDGSRSGDSKRGGAMIVQAVVGRGTSLVPQARADPEQSKSTCIHRERGKPR